MDLKLGIIIRERSIVQKICAVIFSDFYYHVIERTKKFNGE